MDWRGHTYLQVMLQWAGGDIHTSAGMFQWAAFFVKNSCTEFHGNPTGGSVADTRSQPVVVFAHSVPVTWCAVPEMHKCSQHLPLPNATTSSTQCTQAMQFCPRSASPNYGFRPAPCRTEQAHSSSLYLKTTKLTKLSPTAKWRSFGRSAEVL